ncbi:MAG TPA: toll/interleukin-1 receptor domain-containing protein, partial [Terricaulis sp.]|nr:toll/interleukin-1 receptor domain-containing protein [Terricaulis sp.]
MADVFISYKRNDRAVAQALAKRLEEAGYSCWWDSSLVAGEHFNAAIQRQLDEARCVLVLWTRESHESQWVQAEAISGFNRQALISARLDDVELRYPFPIVQTADLRAFTGQGDHPGLFDVVRGIAAKVGRAPRATESAPNAFHETHGELGRARTDATPEPTRRSYALALPIAAVVFVAAIAFAATLFMASREAPSSRDYAAQPDSVVVAATEEDVSAKAPALPPAAEPEQNVGREQDGAANRQVPTHVASTAV